MAKKRMKKRVHKCCKTPLSGKGRVKCCKECR